MQSSQSAHASMCAVVSMATLKLMHRCYYLISPAFCGGPPSGGQEAARGARLHRAERVGATLGLRGSGSAPPPLQLQIHTLNY